MKIEELPVKPPPSMERVMPFAPFPVASLVGATPTSASSQMLLSAGSPSQSASGCCESGRPIFTDPSTGQTICSCQYVSSMGLLGGAASRVPGSVGDSLLASAYAAHGYLPLGGDPSTLCATLGSPYDLKDAPEALRTLAHSSAYYTYDPALATYPYSYGALDLNSAARRKNATRENTNTLKAWLYEHRKNPYPTKGEKIMLAIITKMTLTQVSTWFANARRRLKKENKMTWSPRPGIKDDEDDDGEDGDVKDKVSEDHDLDPNHSISMEDSDDEDIIVDEGREDHHHQSAALLLARIPHPLVPGHAVSMATSTSTCSHSNPASPNNDAPASPTTSTENEESASEQTLNDPPPPTGLRLNNNDEKAHDIESNKIDKTSSEGRPSPVPDDSKKKPKIWSLADVATSGSSSHTEKSRSPFTLSHPPGNFPHPIYAQSQLHPRFPPHYQNGLRPWINGYPLPGAFLVGPPAFPGPEMLPVSLAPSLVAPRTMDMTSQLNGAGSYPVALLTTSTVSRPSETHTLASKSPETPPKPRSIHGGPPPTAHVHHISRMELASRTSPTGSHGNGSSGSHVTSIAGPKVIRPLPLTQKIIPGVKH